MASSIHKILLVDDCLDTGHLVRTALMPHEVVQTTTLAQATHLIKAELFSLFLIDVGLPDGNGFEFCKKLTDDFNHSKVPKIMLTAEREDARKVFGFYCGADDYIVKPFVAPELKARVDARIRSVQSQHKPVITLPGIELDLRNFKAVNTYEQRKSVNLTPTEFRILLTLIEYFGTMLSREQILRQLWKQTQVNIAKRGLDSHISRLRKKIAKTGIRITSVYSCGYLLEIKEPDFTKAPYGKTG